GWSSLFGFCYVCLFFFLRICRAVRSTVFPYTTLFRSTEPIAVNSSWSRLDAAKARACAQIRGVYGPGGGGGGGGPGGAGGAAGGPAGGRERKARASSAAEGPCVARNWGTDSSSSGSPC